MVQRNEDAQQLERCRLTSLFLSYLKYENNLFPPLLPPPFPLPLPSSPCSHAVTERMKLNNFTNFLLPSKHSMTWRPCVCSWSYTHPRNPLLCFYHLSPHTSVFIPHTSETTELVCMCVSYSCCPMNLLCQLVPLVFLAIPSSDGRNTHTQAFGGTLLLSLYIHRGLLVRHMYELTL